MQSFRPCRRTDYYLKFEVVVRYTACGVLFALTPWLLAPFPSFVAQQVAKGSYRQVVECPPLTLELCEWGREPLAFKQCFFGWADPKIPSPHR